MLHQEYTQPQHHIDIQQQQCRHQITPVNAKIPLIVQGQGHKAGHYIGV